jgi:hypothetical protein
MLSDILSEAADAIARQLDGDFYDEETKEKAWEIVKAMDRMRLVDPGLDLWTDVPPLTEAELGVVQAARRIDPKTPYCGRLAPNWRTGTSNKGK